MNESTPLIESSRSDTDSRLDHITSTAKIWFGKRRFFVLGSTLVIVGMLLIAAMDSKSPSLRRTNPTDTEMMEAKVANVEHKSLELTSSKDSSKVSIKVTNEYSGRKGFEMFKYPFLDKAHLMEPHRESYITTSGLSSSCGVSWSLIRNTEDSDGSEKSDTVVTSGYSADATYFIAQAKGPGKFTLQLKQACVDDGSHQFQVYVKYVRRELLSLTDNDREEFLDALKTLAVVNTVEGRELYGEDYKSFHYLATMHNDAVTGDCDQFHGGEGFLNNHVFLGAYLEQSLQLVNPRTALHYLEYTKYFMSDAFLIDHMENSNDGGAWSEFFTSKWFGSNDPFNGTILDGRWANMQIPVLNDDFFEKTGLDKYYTRFPNEDAHKTNPYGLLRAPWNFSPSRTVLRFNNVNYLSNTTDIESSVFARYSGISCEYYYNFLQQDVIGKPLATLLDKMEDRTHGFAHFTFGGAGGVRAAQRDAILRERFGFDDTDLVFVTANTHALIKNYITAYDVGHDSILECHNYPFDYETGKVDDKQPQCIFVPECIETEEQVDNILNTIFAVQYYHAFNDKVLALDFEEKKAFLSTLLIGQDDGDMAGSSAACDPLFWVLHGAIERFFQRIMFEDVLSGMNYVSGEGSSCEGHAPNGTKTWLEGYYLLDRSIAVSNLTNVELVQILDPRSDAYADLVSFVYESSSWDWCPDFDSYFVLQSEVRAESGIDDREDDDATRGAATNQRADFAAVPDILNRKIENN